jgi:hypothetical protein
VFLCLAKYPMVYFHEYRFTQFQRTSAITDTPLLVRYNVCSLYLDRRMYDEWMSDQVV